MKYSEEEAICEITIFYSDSGEQIGPEHIYENIVVSRAVNIFKAMDLPDILKRLDLNLEGIPSGSFINFFVQMLTSIDCPDQENLSVILQKRWEFH